MQNLDPRRARWIKVRMGFLCGLLAVGLGLIVASAYSIQIEDGPEWREMAERQRQRRLHLVPKRGSIYDRNGTPLAVSVEVPSISMDAVELLRGADDRRMEAIAKDAAARVAKALDLPSDEVERRIIQKKRFTWLKRRVSEKEALQVRELSDPDNASPIRGLNVEGEGHRFYPNRELAGPILGFVSPDGEGKDGLEIELDDELRGHAEEVRGLRDRSGRLLFSDPVKDEQALAGHNVYLTIDQGIQYTAEQELDAAVRTHEAKSGTAIVLDPNTGEILALANSPGYNPNDYGSSEVESRRDRAITDRFEPGSTMKVFTLASALAARTLSPTQTLYCEQGRMPLDNVVIHDTHPAGTLTVTQVLALSSNIGASKIALSLGGEQLYESLRRFGFGEETGIPLPGEASGILRSRARPWVPVETAEAAFGQGIGITAIQLAMAVAAIANGGRLLEPLLIKRVTDGTGAVVRESVPHVKREVVSAQVAHTMAEMMVAVTEGDGTGVEAAIPGFRVAGKTGTAQKADAATGRYDRIGASSFIGFVPAERPRLVAVVVLDEPDLVRAGGFVAAPAFRRIMEMSLRYLGVMSKEPVASPAARTPLLAKSASAPAERRPAAPPESGTPIAAKPALGPIVDGARLASSGADNVRVPDLRGASPRQAVKALFGLGLTPSMQGTGRLLRQDPEAGAMLAPGSTVTLVFEPSS
jgi:cell division protein FtsI (penicillin-binding protein 3)